MAWHTLDVQHIILLAMTKPDTGEVLYDLPSPYVPHACGLLHLPRFIAKIRKHLINELPPSYQRNFKRGFDGFLCLHLGVDPEDIVEAVRTSRDNVELDAKLKGILPEDLQVYKWNRELIQKGTRGMGKEKLEEVKAAMGIPDREDLHSFADMIEFDEDRID